MIWLLAAASAGAAIPAGLRWLRIAQREHYIPGSVSRFAWRWWASHPVNYALLGLGVLGVIGSAWSVWAGFLAPISQLGPVGLAVTGLTSPLVWTARLRRLALVSAVLLALVVVGGALGGSPPLVAAGPLTLPLLFDLALGFLRPVERSFGSRWVEQAAARLASVNPEVVAITGSYGKTSTKLYTAHLLAGARRTVASPGSFNNRMGLARAINEGLAPGTEVFVAEMGTYGTGEIADMCRWVRPRVSAIVSIGPVHLERFGSEETIVVAKSEILDRAEVGVICVDHPLLDALARERAGSMEIIEVSTGNRGRVQVGSEIVIDDRETAVTPDRVFPANLAVALGVGLALGVEAGHMVGRLPDLPDPEHRQSLIQADSGLVIIDDTFNSNPAGARLALARLVEMGTGGQKAVVTPGMVELGPAQRSENRDFAAEAARVVDHLVIVGRTNRAALLEGSAAGTASVTVVGSRQEAVDWVREHLGRGDAVLYENDLPDHYP
ncbi:MAG: Mur ligase family protein [Acidimicrobiia bacterium]